MVWGKGKTNVVRVYCVCVCICEYIDIDIYVYVYLYRYMSISIGLKNIVEWKKASTSSMIPFMKIEKNIWNTTLI